MKCHVRFKLPKFELVGSHAGLWTVLRNKAPVALNFATPEKACDYIQEELRAAMRNRSAKVQRKIEVLRAMAPVTMADLEKVLKDRDSKAEDISERAGVPI